MGCIRIDRVSQGFEVHVDDPKIIETNKGDGPWKDSSVEYTFDSWDKVVEFLSKVVDKALPIDEYSTTFDKAAKEVNDEQ